MVPTKSTPGEIEQIEAARRGDSRAFGELTEARRRELQVHCYRILGSVHEAEDMVQETLLKAWRRIDTYEGRASFRSWLYKIATNSCLDALDQRRSRRLLPAQSVPASDPRDPIAPPSLELTWLEPYPDEWLPDAAAINPESRISRTESISLAFLTAIQELPASQRAVLILRDVLDFSANETAEILEHTISSVNSALHRARAAMSGRQQGREIGQTMKTPTDDKTQQVLDRFVEAWERADVDRLISLLKEDAVFAMPPSPSWYQGRSSIGQFASATIFADERMFPGAAAGRWRLLRTNVNGSPGFALYQRAENTEYLPFGIIALVFEKGALNQIISFLDPTLPTYFGLPAKIT